MTVEMRQGLEYGECQYAGCGEKASTLHYPKHHLAEIKYCYPHYTEVVFGGQPTFD